MCLIEALVFGIAFAAVFINILGRDDSRTTLGEYAAVPQRLVIQQPPDLGQPGIGEFAVVVPGPGIQQRDAFEAEQIGKRVLIDHES